VAMVHFENLQVFHYDCVATAHIEAKTNQQHPTYCPNDHSGV
jgi:hypothetical protein